MRYFLALSLFVCLTLPAAGEDPPAPKPATIPDTIAAIQATMKQRAALDKQEADLRALLAKLLADQQAELDKLNVKPPAPPPPPDTRLRDKLAAAVKTDAADKADVMQLAAIYREAAKVATDPTVPSSAELLARVRKVSSELLGADALPAVRAAAAEELLAALGKSSDDALTDAQRKRVADTFVKLAATLEELVK